MRLSKLRRQIVLCIDIMILLGVSCVLAALEPAGQQGGDITSEFVHLLVLSGCITFFQILFRTNDSLWRYGESSEFLAVLAGSGFGALLYLILSRFVLQPQLSGLFLLSVLASSLTGMILMRFLYRIYRSWVMIERQKNRRRVAIIGAGEAGVTLAREMMTVENSLYLPLCFVDDKSDKIGARALGLPIRGPIAELPKIIAEYNISELLFAIPACGLARRREILDICSKSTCRVRTLPDYVSLTAGKSLLLQLSNVQVEDLLGREPIHLRQHDTDTFIEGKNVLVTGGGGSIGSELCRQIAARSPARLVILDIYENSAYEIEQELRAQYGDSLSLYVEIATICDRDKLEQVFAAHQPHIVFHAAAHKHVPLMEANPDEAVKNNIFGTWNLVLTAHLHHVKKFVQISTDKAVNPTNVMGATKRFCEMMLQCVGPDSQTDFVAVRFGNVLGSNGSVIPLFKSQIERGGPVTITDKRIIRYFMTIPEAVSLVLEAGAMAKQSEVYVLDMGQPVKIIELAENLIRMSGYVPYTEMPIVEIGLRPGEKLYEELLTAGEGLSKTEHDQIFVEKQKPVPRSVLEASLFKLQHALETKDKAMVVRALHEVITTYHTPEEVNALVKLDA